MARPAQARLATDVALVERREIGGGLVAGLALVAGLLVVLSVAGTIAIMQRRAAND